MWAPNVILFALAAFLRPTLAAWNNLTLSDYKLKQSGYSTTIAALDKALPIVNVSDILADLNHVNTATSPNIKNLVASTAYRWEDTADFDDQDTEKWYPQGITTSADAYSSGVYESQKVQLITWHSDHYDDGKRGARVSFVSPGGKGSGKRYRHVLLVEPKGDDDFQAIKGLHAGGVAWYGSLIYVVDTTGGLRVFDLDHIYKVDANIKEDAGRVGSKYGAYGYKYVLPQARTYNWQSKPGLTDLRFSFVSLDRTTTPDSILVGEYHATRTDCRLIRWDIDYTNRLLKTSSGIATASEAVSHGNTKIQGAVSINSKWFLTQSGGDLISYSWKGGKKTTENTFTSVPEDLSYEKGVGIWTLQEQRGHRHVFAVDPAKF